ncbi:hypothetical protein C0J52_28281 [Blattella germanica]|nr:hypothetical protein C0J52_28281 [Blattella germanica]
MRHKKSVRRILKAPNLCIWLLLMELLGHLMVLLDHLMELMDHPMDLPMELMQHRTHLQLPPILAAPFSPVVTESTVAEMFT